MPDGAMTNVGMPAGVPLTALPEYMIDVLQRSVLFLDVLRRRANEQAEMQSRPLATVMRFDTEVIMSGKTLSRPMNYTLSKVIAPALVVTDPDKRPVVVVDPRAGQGPGIGGFKAESEIGDALNAGHPVYFIGFSAIPEPGQQFLDVVEGQVKFFERVVALHPNAPLPFAIGNCQAGYQTLMIAMLRPDLFGPCLIAGAPMSFWQGVRGKNPMRYAAGLNGGSWITALVSDLSKGKFDGTWLVLNFDKLGPANWLWSKQYDLYADVDSNAQRYIDFEKWWGDFIELNGDELQFLVDNLFIGDKLTRNELHASDGTVFDVRNVTSPIIVFTSMGDNISPPQETLGWILDLYATTDDIRAARQTIVYCLDQKIGHLALFVSSKVGAVQDEEFVQLMDVIDCLPPGLFEMIMTPRPPEIPRSGFITGDSMTHFEARSLDDIRALGRNSAADDRAFATVARYSQRNLAIYRTFMQPWIRACVSQPMADMGKALNPLRLSYTLFADCNPLMTGVAKMAEAVTAARWPVASDNPYLALQTRLSEQITTALEVYQKSRDDVQEQLFFAIYGAPVVQAMVGLDSHSEVRPPPVVTPEMLAARKVQATASEARLLTGGFDEALIRAVLYVISDDHVFDHRSALALSGTRKQLTHLSLAEFKTMVRQQAFVLHGDRDAAVLALADIVPENHNRSTLLNQVGTVISGSGPVTVGEARQFARLSQALPVVDDPPRPALRASRAAMVTTTGDSGNDG